MKIHNLFYILALVTCSALQVGCAGKIVVTKVPDAPAQGAKLQNMDGVVYALPRTVVKLALPIERSKFTKGSYSEFTELFFPESSKDDASDDKSEAAKFAVGKPVFTTSGEPDLSKLYFVKLTGRGPVDRTASFDYTEQGTASGVQAEADNYTTDIVLSVVSAAAGIATRAAYAAATRNGGAGIQDKKKCQTSPSDADVPVYDFFIDPNSPNKDLSIFNRYCELKPLARKQIQDAVVAANKDVNAPLNKALDAYADINALTKARHDLITQQNVSISLPSLDSMLKEIDAALASKMAKYFTGQTKKDTWTPAFELRPAAVTDKPIDVLTLDEANGVCLIQPLPPQDEATSGFLAKKGCAPATSKIVRVRFSLNGADQMFSRVKAAFKEDGERSFRYVIPAASIATLEVGDCSTDSSCRRPGAAALTIGQFGAEVSLPASSGGRSLNYTLKFFEATGALKSFSLTSKTAMQAAVVNSLSSTANGVLDAKNKQDQAAAAKADELAKLDRQAKILQDQATIKQLCAQLQVSCEP